jgi:nitrogen fixation/metabolism regulation signal transduction histidine kinase
MVAALIRLARRGAPLFLLFFLLIASLYLLGDLTESSSQFGQYYLWLLGFNSLFVAALAVLIAINLLQTVRQAAASYPGSRLSLRFVLMFGALSLIPVAVVYWFSVRFLHQGIDSWFDVRVESALTAALQLSQSALDDSMRELRRRTVPMATALADTSDNEAALVLGDLIEDTRAVELTLFASNNRVIATISEVSNRIVPGLPDDSILQLLSQGRSYVGLDPIKDLGLHIRVIVPVPTAPTETGFRALQALYPVSSHIDGLAQEVQEALGKYHELLFLRSPLKRSLTVSLSLVLLSGVLFAVWAAFYSSRQLMAPILELAEGTRAVAAGDFHKKLQIDQKDDLGFLAHSFNQMTDRLAEARDEAQHSQKQVEAQRAYLETVLLHLSSGVITLDVRRHVRTFNAAAEAILGLDLKRYLGRDLNAIAEDHSAFKRFWSSLNEQLRLQSSAWRQEQSLNDGPGVKVLVCHGAKLPTDASGAAGHVIVFDDVTALIQAQRDAAWGEVARRLAHEIKNPLTPIQLAAERLRRKLPLASGSQAIELLERSTRTIVQQVESMKAMVNAFADYARTASGKLGRIDLNELVGEVAELYRCDANQPKLDLCLEQSRPFVDADHVRLRQVLHNLLKNAQEALSDQAAGKILIQTRNLPDGTEVELTVSDNGPGIQSDLIQRLFEPYVTTKPRGTGLGLAIVKKIVEEHGGSLSAENRSLEGGALIRIRLPLTHDAHAEPSVAA